MIKTTSRQDKALLLKTAVAVADELRQRCDGTAIKVRLPSAVSETNTGGWRAILGSLGKSTVRLEIWFDSYAGYGQRKFSACFYSKGVGQLRRIAGRVAKRLRPHRVITEKDAKRDGFLFLATRLSRDEFNVPIFETYTNRYGKWAYYGIYDPTVRADGSAINPYLCSRAAAFFESVARTLSYSNREYENGKDLGRLSKDAGFESNPKVRRAIESRAMEVVERYYRNRGFKVKDVHKNHPYDFEYQTSGKKIFVEVKGTRNRGETITVTAGEVRFAQKHTPNVVLCVVHSIKVSGKQNPKATGGKLTRENWSPDHHQLKPIAFRYKLRLAE